MNIKTILEIKRFTETPQSKTSIAKGISTMSFTMRLSDMTYWIPFSLEKKTFEEYKVWTEKHTLYPITQHVIL